MKTKSILTMFGLLLAMQAAAFSFGCSYQVNSPDKHLQATVSSVNGHLRWNLSCDGAQVVDAELQLIVDDQSVRMPLSPKTVRKGLVRLSFDTQFYKKARVDDTYNQLVLNLKNGFQLEFRVYNDGAAYRFVSQRQESFVLNNERADFHFSPDSRLFIPYVNDNRGGEPYCYSFESYYDEVTWQNAYSDSLAITPLAVCLPGGLKAIVMDAGVEDYPGMMLRVNKHDPYDDLLRLGVEATHDTIYSLRTAFAPYPLEQQVGGFDRLNLVPTRRADYIARIDGPRTLPWRAVVVTRNDADILNCDMAQRLAPPCRLSDTSWICPGKVAWDWWNNLNLTGVSFKTGMNTRTYQYYIDFAARNHLEYIIIDEGWSGKESLLADLNSDIDLPLLLQYGRERGVGIILWSSWRNLVGNNPDAPIEVSEAVMKHYADMGVKGFKIDFFDRDDQQVIRSAYRIAEAAARLHLLVDYHGLKPFGIQRAYPNVVNFEGVKGLENSKWEPRVGDGPLHNQPRYDVTAPFLRMLAGPMDYTPGAMRNAHRDHFFGNNDHPMSQGTRAHQVAMYTIFEAPLQMLADAPTAYEQEQETTNFIAQVPTTFDETVALSAQLGEYIVLARRKGSTWYVAAMTDWTPRQLRLPLSFLGSGQYSASIFADGVNAAKESSDYTLTSRQLSSTDTLTLQLAQGGGWAAILTPSAQTAAVLSQEGLLVKPSDQHISYVGRMVTTSPDSYRFSYPGTQMIMAFEGTQVKMMCKPRSGYFMVTIDQAEPFKLAFTGEKDSVATLATGLPRGRHEVRVMYCIEGYEYLPEFRGFILEPSARLLSAPALSSRRMEFVGNSITCGYGNENPNCDAHFEFDTENHYYSYAQLTARALGADAQIIARSGIGAYRNYGGPKAGTPDINMPAQYDYTLIYNKEERWDFSRFVPQVVCINLGTNDLSTNNYDLDLLRQGYQTLLRQVRTHNPQAKVVFLCGSMLGGKELELAKSTLNEVVEQARCQGDAEVYRFDFTPQDGSLGYGADWHPSLAQHQKMACELTAYLSQLMQWD